MTRLDVRAFTNSFRKTNVSDSINRLGVITLLRFLKWHILSRYNRIRVVSQKLLIIFHSWNEGNSPSMRPQIHGLPKSTFYFKILSLKKNKMVGLGTPAAVHTNYCNNISKTCSQCPPVVIMSHWKLGWLFMSGKADIYPQWNGYVLFITAAQYHY